MRSPTTLTLTLALAAATLALSLVPGALADDKGKKKPAPKKDPKAPPAASAREEEVLLSGKVVGPDGKPVKAEFEVRGLYRPEVRATARFPTDASGAFAIKRAWLDERLPPYLKDCVVVIHDPTGKLAPGNGLLGRAGGLNLSGNVRLERGATPNVVVTAAGKPVRGAAIIVEDKDGERLWGAVTTDAKGRAKVGPVPAEMARFLVYADGFVPARRWHNDLKDGAEVKIDIPAGVSLSGSILDPDGKPLAEAVVGVYRGEGFPSLLPMSRWAEDALAPLAWKALNGSDPYEGDPGGRPRDHMGLELISVVTGEDGAFTLAGVPSGARQVVAMHARFATVIKDVTAPTPAPLEISLGRGGTLRGTARRQDGKPATGVVEAATETGPAMKVARVRPDGTYEIEGLVPRVYSVRLSDDGTLQDIAWVAGEKGRGTRRYGMTVAEGDTATCDFGGGARLFGKIRSKKPLPLVFDIVLVPKDEQGARERWQAAGCSSMQPEYEFAEVKPGLYLLGVLSVKGRAEAAKKRLENPGAPRPKLEEEFVLLCEIEVKAGVAEIERVIDVPEGAEIE